LKDYKKARGTTKRLRCCDRRPIVSEEHHLSNSADTGSASNSEVNCKEFYSVLLKRFTSERDGCFAVWKLAENLEGRE